MKFELLELFEVLEFVGDGPFDCCLEDDIMVTSGYKGVKRLSVYFSKSVNLHNK